MNLNKILPPVPFIRNNYQNYAVINVIKSNKREDIQFSF